MNFPAPLVDSSVDLRGMSSFMLDVDRLLASELVALGTPEECWAALMLWCRAWKQVPAASLPDDDRVLAAFSGAGKRWPKVKDMALRGFVRCSDGRLYHKVLAEEASAAWKRRQAYVEKRERDAGRLKRWRETKQSETSSETHEETLIETDEETQNETPSETRFVAERDVTGTGTKKESSLRSPKKAGSRLPEDWRPAEADVAYARSQGVPEPEISREGERFRDFWMGKPGQGGVKLDWSATWRNWIRSACDRKGWKPGELPLNGASPRPTPPRDERDAEGRLNVGRERRMWPRPRWGPAPGEAGCTIPPHLIKPSDHGWGEWSAD